MGLKMSRNYETYCMVHLKRNIKFKISYSSCKHLVYSNYCHMYLYLVICSFKFQTISKVIVKFNFPFKNVFSQLSSYICTCTKGVNGFNTLDFMYCSQQF